MGGLHVATVAVVLFSPMRATKKKLSQSIRQYIDMAWCITDTCQICILLRGSKEGEFISQKNLDFKAVSGTTAKTTSERNTPKAVFELLDGSRQRLYIEKYTVCSLGAETVNAAFRSMNAKGDFTKFGTSITFV